MTISLLELAAEALGPLADDVMLVGGACLTLWISDPAAPPPRPTKDVDVVVEVASLVAYQRFSSRLRARGFAEDMASEITCRWQHARLGLVLDAMPSDERILGFSNRWQKAALPHAVDRELPSGAALRVITPPYLLATKLEAFRSRGAGDLLGSRDFADVVALIDGRAELGDELSAAPAELGAFLSAEAGALLALPRILDGIAGALPPDRASQARAQSTVLPRLRQIADDARSAVARQPADTDDLLDPSL